MVVKLNDEVITNYLIQYDPDELPMDGTKELNIRISSPDNSECYTDVAISVVRVQNTGENTITAEVQISDVIDGLESNE